MSGDDDRALNDRRFHRLLLSRYGAHPARGEPSLLFNSASARSAFDIPWETFASAARFSARWRSATFRAARRVADRQRAEKRAAEAKVSHGMSKADRALAELNKSEGSPRAG